MPNPKVKLKIEADGTVKEGTLSPEIGATVEVQFSKAAQSAFGIEYTHPDSVRLSLSGAFKMKAGGAGKVSMSGALTESLMDGNTDFRGTLTWDFPKEVSVKVTTRLTDSSSKVGAQVTIQF